ncbi:MAG: DUF5011 domain-containing protein [Fibrobacteria bacterium]|nr:DUF5011 domain-containing protein [Fibrobacteria bacterium]
MCKVSIYFLFPVCLFAVLLLSCDFERTNLIDPGADGYVGDSSAYDNSTPIYNYLGSYDSLFTDVDSVIISGTVFDANQAVVKINGLKAEMAYPHWSGWVKLAVGANIIVVQISDKSIHANTVVDSLVIFLIAVPSKPVNVVLEQQGRYIKVNWTDKSSNEKGFEIKRSTDNVTFSALGEVGPGTGIFIDSADLLQSTPYYYVVEAFNDAGKSGNSSSNVIVYSGVVSSDTTGPEIIFIYPEEDTVNTSPYPVALQVEDSNGVASVYVNDSLATKIGDYWRVDVPLTGTSEKLRVVAVDNTLLHNRTEKEKLIKYVPSAKDTKGPVLTYRPPTLKTDTVSVNTYKVTLDVFDGSGVKFVKVNATYLGYAENTYSGVISLTEGTNTLMVISEDSLGNTTEDSLMIVYDTDKIDETAPDVQITSHQNNTIVATRIITLSGTVSDNSGVATVSLNDSSIIFSEPDWSTEVTLIHGWNPIVVSATDKSDNNLAGMDSIKIAYNIPPHFRSVRDTIVKTGEEYRIKIIADDPDGDVLSFTWGQNIKLATPEFTPKGDTVSISKYIPLQAGVDSFFIISTDFFSADTVRWVVRVNNPVADTDSSSPELSFSVDTVEVILGSSYLDTAVSCYDSKDGNRPVVRSGLVNTDSVGMYVINYDCSDEAGNAAGTATLFVHVILAPDTLRPVVTLEGKDTLEVMWGENFTDPGANCVDERDGDLEVTVSGTVSTFSLGTKKLFYDCIDKAGNRAIKIQRVVIVRDTVKPVITLVSPNDTVFLIQGENYADPGVSCTDNKDGSLSSRPNFWPDSKTALGVYEIIYSCTDVIGNVAVPKTRIVKVQVAPDTTKPIITLDGNDTLVFILRQVYSDPGYHCTDDRDGDISITPTGLVNTDSVSQYEILYTCSDQAGNTAVPKTRIVNVIDNTGMFTDVRDSKSYKTVLIGTQTWMAENLAYLPQVDSVHHGSEDIATGKYYYVQEYTPTGATEPEEVANAKAMSTYQTYGVLYNWNAAMDGAASSSASPSGVQGACPDGWHLPSHQEFLALERYLGMDSSSAEYIGWRGTTEGEKLKVAAFYGTDVYGFAALPATGRRYLGSFFPLDGSCTYYWSSTQYDSGKAKVRLLDIDQGGILYSYPEKTYGYSVRCVKN